MSVKSRLQQRKASFTLEQAARRLGDEFGEEITIEDIVELVVEHELDAWLHVHSAQRALNAGLPESPRDLITFMPPGLYRVVRNPALMRHLSYRLEPDGLGAREPLLFMWFLSGPSSNAGTIWRAAPLTTGAGLTPAPFPPLKNLRVKREDLEAFIKKAANQDSEMARDAEELRALEALGLLAETVAKQAPRYQCNGKPNKAQIAEAMSNQAGEVYGTSKSKLQRLLSDALDAWEERRG